MYKKVSSLLLIIFIFATSVFAQEQEADKYEMKYLVNGQLSVSGFGGSYTSFGAIHDEFAVFVGGAGAVIINQKFFIGGFGEGLSTQHQLEEVYYGNSQLDHMTLQMGYGGLWTGYLIRPYDMVHVKLDAKLGWGEISMTDLSSGFYENIHNDYVFVAIPTVGINLNVTPWFRLGFDVGYRFVGGISDQTFAMNGEKIYNSQDYRGLHTTVSLLFGVF